MPALVVSVSLVVYAGLRLWMTGGPVGAAAGPQWLRVLFALWHGVFLPLGFLVPSPSIGAIVAGVSVLVVLLTATVAVAQRRTWVRSAALAEVGEATLRRPKPPGIWTVDLDSIERSLSVADPSDHHTPRHA